MEGTNQNQELTNDPKPRRSNTWIYLVIIALLLGTNVYLYLQKNKTTEQLSTSQVMLQQADTSLGQLQNEYNASLARLDELTGKNAKLDQQLKDKDSELGKTKSRIKELLTKSNATKADLAEARTLINSLNTTITGYEEQIATLKKENTDLTGQRDSVVKTNSDLSQKVDLAKVLHASNIRLKGINLTHSGKKEKETEKARRVDLLRITFDIDENRIAENGPKELQICITNPANELLSNAAFGSGSFTTADGASKYYSISKTVNLNTGQPVTDISADWQQSAEYAKGNYSVEIYHKGYLIGKGTVSLR
jgi:peptidoglycan hydrolase CwlO-like protein